MKIVARLMFETENLNVILESQICIFNKDGIGYQFCFHKKGRKFKSFFSNAEKSKPRLFMTLSLLYEKRSFCKELNLFYKAFDSQEATTVLGIDMLQSSSI